MLIRPLISSDAAAWQVLWQAYLDACEAVLPPHINHGVWARLSDATDAHMQALGVFDAKGGLQGFAHLVFHPNTWSLQPCCYLEDLFVRADARGQGKARALIEAVYALAQQRDCGRVYWVTHIDNLPARVLYDRVAVATGFIQYRKDFDA